jgi:hypothetical protein
MVRLQTAISMNAEPKQMPISEHHVHFANEKNISSSCSVLDSCIHAEEPNNENDNCNHSVIHRRQIQKHRFEQAKAYLAYISRNLSWLFKLIPKRKRTYRQITG